MKCKMEIFVYSALMFKDKTTKILVVFYLTIFYFVDMMIIENGGIMKKEKTLLILAAGMGSRFGGLKQVEPVGPNGEFIIDYSIYDAIMEGFNKVVFVIKEENFSIFNDTIGRRVSKFIKVEYAFQDVTDLPEGYVVPEGREKPWGTGHAILAAKNLIQEPFAIINADDFYGRDAFRVMAEYLDSMHEKNRYCIVGYLVKNTLSLNGAVKRAVCRHQNSELVELIESSILEENGIITASPLDGSSPFNVNPDDLVSMNMLGFTPSIFEYLEKEFPKFLDENKHNALKSEFLIPDLLYKAKSEQYAKVDILQTNAVWYGVTYREDKEYVVNAINNIVESGKYPKNLWRD